MSMLHGVRSSPQWDIYSVLVATSTTPAATLIVHINYSRCPLVSPEPRHPPRPPGNYAYEDRRYVTRSTMHISPSGHSEGTHAGLMCNVVIPSKRQRLKL